MQYLITKEEKKALEDTYAAEALDRYIIIRGIAGALLARQDKRCLCETYDQFGEIDKREPIKSCHECILLKISKEIENSPFGESNKVASRNTLSMLCGKGKSDSY